MMFQRLGRTRCNESTALSKSIKLTIRGACHSYDCPIMLRKMNICFVVLLPCRNPACSALSLLSAPLVNIKDEDLAKHFTSYNRRQEVLYLANLHILLHNHLLIV